VLLVATGGCTNIADRYSTSADNVAAIRGLAGQGVSVGRFSAANGVAGTEIQCAAIAIAPPDESSFADYIRNALIAELKMAAAYSHTAPITITGSVDALELDASAFSLTGHWFIVLTLNGDGRSFTVSERYSFRSQTLNMTFCEGAARRLASAVQDLIGKVISAPEFAVMVKPH
jgi:hypothetical protein